MDMMDGNNEIEGVGRVEALGIILYTTAHYFWVLFSYKPGTCT